MYYSRFHLPSGTQELTLTFYDSSNRPLRNEKRTVEVSEGQISFMLANTFSGEPREEKRKGLKGLKNPFKKANWKEVKKEEEEEEEDSDGETSGSFEFNLFKKDNKEEDSDGERSGSFEDE